MTTSTALCYTPGYAPNEQIGQMYDRFGPWTDIYALGATVYNLLTYKKPPMAIDIEEDEEEAFDFPASVSEDMRKLVVWMMQPKRKARPQNVDEIINKMGDTNDNHLDNKTIVEETVISTTDQIDSEETILAGSEPYQKQVPKDFIDENNIHAVDLGLSVLWADYNIGGTQKSPIGGLYGWGDPTGEKTSQMAKDYLDYKGGLCLSTPLNISGTKYDIATQKWGERWRTPTRENWKELYKNCKWIKIREHNKKGYQVIGPNGNSIFLPTTGIRFGESISNPDSGYYWTSELVANDRECAYYYYFDFEKPNDLVSTRNYVYSGRAVRPVCDKKETI